ncbi:MAG: exodeoxyribonuclease V subunit gamma [Bacteroidetes bacterium]|nr:exodeoxyribonuclease V subunit gamma [Bacteroidota bacterium]MCW5896942.1 exodeoxyribonuclease V subunit gamma [Bacteroidota bacterium]
MPITLKQKSKPSLQQPGLFSAIDSVEHTLLVVPTKRRSRHLVREMLSGGGKTVAQVPIFTLESLAFRLFEAAFENLRVVADPIQTLLFGQAIVASRGTLRYFHLRDRGNVLPRGTLDKVIQVIRHLKEYGIYPENLAEELVSEEEGDQPKLRDIITIYSTYESLLSNLAAVDPEGVFKTLHHTCPQPKFENAFRDVFPDVQSVSIVGFDEFTEPELGFIQKLSSMDVEVTLVFDFQPGNEALFGHLEQNYRRFLDMKFAAERNTGSGTLILNRPQVSDHVAQTLRNVAANMFRRDGEIERERCADHVTVVKAKDRIAEVEFICRLIKQLVAEKPALDLSRVCVAMYMPQLYTHIMREQFTRYGIPVNITDRNRLAQSPVVIAIVGLLEVAVRGFRREDVLGTVGSTYFECMNNGTSVDSSNLMKTARELRIVGGARSWLSRIDRQIQKVRQTHLISLEEEEQKRAKRDINKLEQAKQDIQWLESLLADILPDQTPAQFFMSLQHLLETLHLSQRIVAIGVKNRPELVEQDARAFAKFIDVVEQTMHVLEYQAGKDQRYSLRFYVEQLKIALSQERYNVREQFGRGVLVTSIDETRGLPLDVMIVAGLVDGEFPSVYQSELFFGNKRLAEREQRHTWENRYLFYQAITNWSEHLYLTYPEQEVERDLVRSGFIDAVLAIAEVEQWEYPGNVPFEYTIHSADDYLRHHGRALLSEEKRKEDDVPEILRDKVKVVEKALLVESNRVQTHNLPEFEGMILNDISEEAKESLMQLKHRVYSVSQLESYGKCPYQFFVRRILRLNSVEDVEEEFSPLDKGSVLHDILFEFYVERRDQKLPSLVGCSDTEFSDAHKMLLAIAERKLDEIDIPDAFWELEKELILGNKSTGGEGTLREFLEHERKRNSPLQPGFFEVGFGPQPGSRNRIDTQLFSDEPVVAGNIQLSGKVDRVEIGDEAFVIVDYKSGNVQARLDDVRSGISLQLPIYLYTIEQMLAAQFRREITPAGGLYYKLRSPVELKVGVGSGEHKTELEVARSNANLLPSDAELKELIAQAINLVNSFVDEMTQGKFPLTSHDKIDKVCTYCDYKTICRIQTIQRVAQPDPEKE